MSVTEKGATETKTDSDTKSTAPPGSCILIAIRDGQSVQLDRLNERKPRRKLTKNMLLIL